MAQPISVSLDVVLMDSRGHAYDMAHINTVLRDLHRCTDCGARSLCLVIIPYGLFVEQTSVAAEGLIVFPYGKRNDLASLFARTYSRVALYMR